METIKFVTLRYKGEVIKAIVIDETITSQEDLIIIETYVYSKGKLYHIFCVKYEDTTIFCDINISQEINLYLLDVILKIEEDKKC